MDLTGTRTPYTDLKVIERDQAIAMRVVAASNAAYYGFSGKIRTISQAILILGFDLVRGLAITTTVFNSMPAKEKDRLLELWAHSFETAQAAALIAQRTGAIEKESAFLAGLFHDIGRPVLLQTCETETDISPSTGTRSKRKRRPSGRTTPRPARGSPGFKLPEDSTLAILTTTTPRPARNLRSSPHGRDNYLATG